MSTTLSLVRSISLLIALLSALLFSFQLFSDQPLWISLGAGAAGGIALWSFLLLMDRGLKKVSFYAFNVVLIGLLSGCLMGYAFSWLIEAFIGLSAAGAASGGQLLALRMGVYLVSTYFGMTLALKSSEEFHISLPFVKLQPLQQDKRDIVIDFSALSDTRLIDLAASGLLDHHLVLPRFLLKELYHLTEEGEESTKAKARRSLEVVKRLESMENLNLRYADEDFPEIKDLNDKVIRMARLNNSNVITTDYNRIKQSTIESTEGIRIINIHNLANALKPLSHSGESISIKIQRYGKEARQGVGYLEDGTMVVVNGGAEFIGDTIQAQVLSVKHTSSGRMIFCNALEGGELLEEHEEASASYEHHQTTIPTRQSASQLR